MGLLGGFFLFLFSKSSVMLFILSVFKLSIKICLIELFSTAVLRLTGGFGSGWEEGVELGLASRTVTGSSRLSSPLSCPRGGAVTEGRVPAQSSVDIFISRNTNKGNIYLLVSSSEILV